MPYYQITVKVKNGNTLSGVREMDNRDIDFAWQFFRALAVKRFGEFNIITFEVVMLSKHSVNAKIHIKKEKKPPRIEGWGEQFH